MIHSLAWRNLWRRRQRTLFTALAMGVGVALSMGSMALQSGIFSEVFDEMVTDTLGHLQLHHPRYPSLKRLHDTLPNAEQLVHELESLPSVRVSTPRLFNVALVGGASNSAGAIIIGVDPRRESKLSEIDLEVKSEGRWLSAEPKSEITLGVKLAEELMVKLGDEVALVGQDAYGGVAQGLYTVVGVIESGLTELDSGGAWIHLHDAQSLFALENQLHEVLIAGGSSASEAMSFGQSVEALAAFKSQVGGLLKPTSKDESLPMRPAMLIQTWREARPSVAQLMDTQRASAYIMLAIVLAIAAIGVLNTMLMSIFERSRELGVMLALGVPPKVIRALIFTESFYLATIAAIIGLSLGGAIDWALVTYGLDFSVNGEGLSYGGVRLSARLYGVFELSAALMSVVALYLMTALAAIWPAIKAARIEPVEAISRGDQ